MQTTLMAVLTMVTVTMMMVVAATVVIKIEDCTTVRIFTFSSISLGIIIYTGPLLRPSANWHPISGYHSHCWQNSFLGNAVVVEAFPSWTLGGQQVDTNVHWQMLSIGWEDCLCGHFVTIPSLVGSHTSSSEDLAPFLEGGCSYAKRLSWLKIVPT